MDGVRVRFPWYKKVSFSSGHFLNVLAISMWFPYNVSFFEKVVGLTPKRTGHIFLVAQVVGAISTPFVGMWSDQCSCKYGRRKIFHLLGVFSIAVSFFFIWHKCLGCTDVSPSYKILYFACFAAVFEFGWASTQIAQLSLIPELAPDRKVKIELNSMRYTFTIIANVLVFACFWVLLSKISGSDTDLTPADTTVFWIMALVVIVLGVCVAMLFQIFVHEDPNVNPLKLKWYRWWTKPQFYLVACLFMTARIVVILPQTYLPLYFTDTLHMDKTSIAKGPLVLFISSFVTTLLIKRFNTAIGDKMTFFLGLAVVWGAAFILAHMLLHYFHRIINVRVEVVLVLFRMWFWVKAPTDDSTSHFNLERDSIYGATILLGAGGATILVISMAMISYLVGSYTGSSAYVYGWMAFSDRLSNGITVQIIQQLTPESNRMPEYYRTVLVCVLFAATGVGLLTISLMYLYRLWEKKRSKLQSSIESQQLDEHNWSCNCNCWKQDDTDSFDGEPAADTKDNASLHTIANELFGPSEEHHYET